MQRQLPSLVLLLSLFVPVSVTAQTITAAISGVVKDSTGGVLPGVTVTFTHLQSNRQVDRRHRQRRPVPVRPAATRRLPGRSDPAGIQERRRAPVWR